MLKTKVAAGELPPVEERLPEEPMVIEPLEEIGEYGGTLRGSAPSPVTDGHDVFTSRYQQMFKLSSDLKVLTPSVNIVKGWEFSKDYKIFTVYLRKGMKWSDGTPFTADDFISWYEDIILNDELTPVKPKLWSPGGELVKVERVNDYTVNFRFAVPYPPIIDKLSAYWGGEPFIPKHYLKKYHIKYNPQANEVAKKEGYDYWWQCFQFHNKGGQGRQDFNFPVLDPWILKKIDSYGNKYFERNPYYWKIDIAGNQLPYIDEQARMLVQNVEIINLKTIAGEFDNAAHHLTLQNYTIYKMGEKKGNYHCILWEKLFGSEIFFVFNFTHKDPILRKIFNDIRFRQAMSLAINRDEINDIVFFGKATPRQATVMPTCRFYEPWMEEYYAEYDPERANRLLDEMGLKWDKKHQYRLRPDGKSLAITAEIVQAEGPRMEVSELVKAHWEEVGVRMDLKEIQRVLHRQRGWANELDVGIWSFDNVTEFAMRARECTMFRPPWHGLGNVLSSIEWWNWYATKGRTGEEPPEKIKTLFTLVFDKWLRAAPGTEEYMEIGKEILTINVKNLFCIGTVGMAPSPVIVKNNLRNTPKEGVWGWETMLWLPYQADQFFFEK